ncbi:MAG: sigma 54-dependent Fis family transcriptional regulator [Myxococcales bacterium]|nr:sigma 54-dependent Fis family transcriptional regulator [Myxococcales bacterium]
MLPRPLAVRLVVDGGGSFTLANGSCVIGAGREADFVVADPAVSRRHLEVTLVAEGVAVRDLESRNGTFSLGQRVDRAVLRPGSTIRVGATDIRIVAEGLPEIQGDGIDGYGRMVGSSLVMRRLFATLARLEGSLVPILVQGESGVGKELVARAIHDGSAVRDSSLVIVNCGATSHELMLSEMFGHAQGAFTGASETRIGAFEAADGGTLFLDEVGELPLDLQPSLLRALEAGEVKRLGENRLRKVDVRVIAATNRDLEEDVAAGRFREDLYYRLAVVKLRVPPLRDRPEDIAPMARAMAESVAGAHLAQSVVDDLTSRSWKGNVRELRNAVMAYLALGVLPEPGRPVESMLPLALQEAIDSDRPYHQQKTELLTLFHQTYFRSLLQKTDGNQAEAARRCGLERRYFGKLMAKYGIKP